MSDPEILADSTARAKASAEPTPAGFCQCGCGTPTRIATKTSKLHGHVVGQPVRFLVGHEARTRGSVALFDQFEIGSAAECWLWTGAMHTGYGLVWSPRFMTAHRAVYEAMVGPVPTGSDVHHSACRTKACVNPAHMEVLTRSEHMRRHMLERPAKTHCKRGHPFDEGLTSRTRPDGSRSCLICLRIHDQARYRGSVS